jgi:hypothetical protein
MERIRIKEIYPEIFHLKFRTQYWETDTFMRLQEFYESPFDTIRGKYFTREYYQDIYVKEYGKFNYHSKWSGFNVPGNIVLKFFRRFLREGDLSKKECILYDLVLSKINTTKDFYLIATHKSEDIDHEISHGFYYLNKQYRDKMNKLLTKYCKHPLIKNLRAELLEMGYAPKFLRDETQAYLSTKSYEGIIIPQKKNGDFEIINEFVKVFKAYK